MSHQPRHQSGPAAAPAWTPAFYATMSGLTALFLTLFADLRVTGKENVPTTGPLLVAANHLNLVDPPLLAVALPRRLRFMAKQELFASWFAGFCIRSFGAFPVARFEGDRKALRAALALLAAREAIGMFPEGHRSGGLGLLEAHPGTAFLALLSDAPVLPVAITGTERIRSAHVLLERPSIKVVIGRPLQLAHAARIRAADVQAATSQIMGAIAALLPSEYRGVYTQV